MEIANVILDIPTRALDRPFDYLVPSGMVVETGCCVLADFSGRPAVGYVVGVHVAPAELDLGRYKFISKVISTPYFDEYAAKTAVWIAHEYVAPLSEAVRLFSPPGGAPKLRKVTTEEGTGWEFKDDRAGAVEDTWVRITPAGREFIPPKAAIKQQAIIEALREGEMRLSELSIAAGAVNAAVKSLEKRGLIVTEKRRRLRGSVANLPTQSDTVKLTDGQEKALGAIDAAMARADGNVVLLDGVTGSGKTEVYLRSIRHVIEEGGSAIVLVPEISLTPQTVGRFRARFGEQVAVLHSGMSAGERFDQWDLCRQGSARVVVGARSALFAPMRNLRLIVIDEEHENTYKQDSSPRYQARDVAARMVALRHATLVLGSATPSMESLAHAAVKAGDASMQPYERVEMPQRVNARELPAVQVVDMGSEFSGGSRSMFSHALQDALSETLAAHEKAVLLFNHRGFASFLLCRECGFVPTCDQCSTSLTYHEHGAHGSSLQCHHCGAVHDVPVRCPRCGSPYLKKMGAGTQQVHDALRALVGPEVTIVRMDADTTRTKGAHEKLLGQFAAADSGILLGTQMIAKGLDFPDVTLVGVISADTMLNLPDFRSGERTYQLLEQVSGRAGRDRLPGKVVIQTYWADHPAILAAAHHDRDIFLASEMDTRRALGYPPFTRLANILLWGDEDKDVMDEAVALSTVLEPALAEAGEDWQMLGPSPCVLARLRGTYRWHILVKAPVGADIASMLAPVFKARRASKTVSLAVDVDPVSLF